MVRSSNAKRRINYGYRKDFPWAVKALERDNFICQDCKKEELDLVVHHLDESRRLGKDKMNNELSNLTTLCRVCHGKRHGTKFVMKNPKKDIISELRNQGKTYREIANYIGVSRQRVHQILNKLTY